MKRWTTLVLVVSAIALIVTGCGKVYSADLALRAAEVIVPNQVVQRSNININFDSVSNPTTWHIEFDVANASRSELGWKDGTNASFGLANADGTYNTVLVNIDANTGKIEDMFATSAPKIGPAPQPAPETKI